MTLPTNYTNLVQSIQEELEDVGAPFVLNIPTAVKTAEDRINRDIDGLFQETSTTLTMLAGSNTLNKPTGYRFAFNLFIRDISTNIRTLLKKMPKDFLTDYWPNPAVTGIPKYYSDNTYTDFVMAPTPSSNFVVDINYAQYPLYLATTNQTNAIMVKYPDLLWYATLVEQTTFARMYEATQLYEGKYQQRLNQIKEETRRERADNTFEVDGTSHAQNRMDKKG